MHDDCLLNNMCKVSSVDNYSPHQVSESRSTHLYSQACIPPRLSFIGATQKEAIHQLLHPSQNSLGKGKKMVQYLFMLSKNYSINCTLHSRRIVWSLPSSDPTTVSLI